VTADSLRQAECARHRAAVIAVAAAAGTRTGLAPGSVDPAGARHLDDCAVCRNEAEQLALLSFAVQRAWRPAVDLEPSADAWPRLRDRVSRRPVQLGRAASSIAGLALGAALTIGLLAPIGLGGSARLGADPPTLLSETGIATSSPAVLRTPEERDEREWLLRQSRERLVVQAAGAVQVAAPIQDVRGPVLPRREQMRYAEDEHTSAVPAAVPSMTVL
jgi:hypothetical protein